MYQNAPPQNPYNNPADIRSRSPAIGIHQQQWANSPPGYYNPPPNGYYPNGMPPPSPADMKYPGAPAAAAALQPPPQRSNSVSNTGLIRLTLRKPMGIVFEPMTDPHNPSQQRGVRICDLPRTGAAALSRKLEVGDELLSINDKTMSRLTFDEIMEFIIEADAERVDLLFRRPLKDKSEKKNEALSPGGLGGIGSNSNSVKWIDESSDVEPTRKDDARDDRKDGGRRARMDDPSVGDDTYTLESQSQYTMDTYDEKYYREEHRDHHRRSKHPDDDDIDGKRRNHKEAPSKKGKRKQDPIESTSFLDMLIDTLCTSVIGRDASGMCSTGAKSKHEESKKNHHKNNKEVYNEDDEFTIDDGTYATYEDRNPKADDVSSAVDDGTMYTEDDGTLTKNDEESYAPINKPSRNVELSRSHSVDKKESKSAPGKSKSTSRDAADNDGEGNYINRVSSKPDPRSSPPARPAYNQLAPDPPTKSQSTTQQQAVDDAMEESAVASAALPLKELEYDDRVDYAADVSVMESLGGPSLLVERARHEYAVSSGAGHAAAHGDNLELQDPELAKLVEIHGDGFSPDPGMTKEETAFRDPYKFYEHAVCALLRENEPEKVRLLSKLMAKYRGRERHLINKLSARYNKEGGQSGSSDQGDRPRTGSGEHLAKPTMSGMEKIHEGSEAEEGTSPLNDPARANLAAIESAKKRMETESLKDNVSRNKQRDDGWPPAMSDPWGTGNVKDTDRKDVPSEAGHEDTSSRDRHTEDEGSYSDGSSYSGDSLDGTSPAVIAQVSELLNYVYGKTSVAGQIDRVSTIMRAYEGREAVLLELLETKALIKANADSSGDSADLPMSLRNSPGLSKVGDGNDTSNNSEVPSTAGGRRSTATPETPVSVLSDPTMAKSPHSIEYPAPRSSPTSAASAQKAKQLASPSDGTFESTATKKKKGIFGGFFGSKKKGKGKFPSGSESVSTSKSGLRSKSSSKKGLSLNQIDDRSI
ncbi:hypothetical protein HJC23_010099 [Cyclotella cryptica]|uniref:PDZ domain-containing protein n=1 Tax=Cyclotella cryptica TaxID=29204 RepID=A0ABD3Q596_9STRA|eukprot:CCRYP_009103-RA/>CCRYP_009103-RA protein AED:0.11 eAED:0.16 QI:0/-1/0/1/-1/1/1/0/983